ncbi:SH3 domain-containing protein [Tabrizicola oligotrophica]|uniref:Peptide-binding protein n=1 Tax=Tabrizicola oligotrophica TaxID=2710650 RepID=A0A6M0QRB0_9RHOB|nr:SH3 domain-containing protein [Tabrizicola oligotrophica]NEY90025.1 peptide-binding protein [Tabrizicola oligotrophica]
MKLWLGLALAATPVMAETAYPSLHDVAGVAATDVLNIRAEPRSASAIIGSLTATETGIEVVAISPDGRWGRVNTGETSGWAALAYLRVQDRPAWFALQGSLHCAGAEPFWAAQIDPAGAGLVTFGTPETDDLPLQIQALWPGDDWRPVAGLSLASATATGMAVIRAESCSDGMSDRASGLGIDLFLNLGNGGEARALRGCCALAP